MGNFENCRIVVRIGTTVSVNSQCRLEGYNTGWFFAKDVDFGTENFSSYESSDENESDAAQLHVRDTVRFNILKIEKDIDSCSPQLLSGCCKAGVFDLLEIHFVQTFYFTGTGEVASPGGVCPLFIARFEKMNLVEWALEGNETDIPKEIIKFEYNKVAIGWVNQTTGAITGRGWHWTNNFLSQEWDYPFKYRGTR